MVGKLSPNDQLSASELPCLMGCSIYKTPSELLKEKINVIIGKAPAPFKTNEAMFWGNNLEKSILKESAERLMQSDPILATDFNGAWHHPDLPFACSLDGTLNGDSKEISTDIKSGIYCVNSDVIKKDGLGILEAKLTSHEPETELPLFRGVLQLQMQMDCTNSSWGAVCVLYKGTELRLFVYKRDEELIAEIHKAIKDFDRRIQKWKKEDEIEWYDFQTPAEASRIFDTPDNDVIDLPDMEESANVIWELRKKIKQQEEMIARTELEIMENMPDHQLATAGNFKINWKTINYKATPERTMDAKPARSLRQSKLKVINLEEKK